MRNVHRFLISLVAALSVSAAYADQPLPVNTQSVVEICDVWDASDLAGGDWTPVTDFDLSEADLAVAVPGGTGSPVDISESTWTAVSGADGCYRLTLSSSATASVGALTVIIQDSSIAPIREKFQVVTSDMFAACCGSSASPLDATAVQAAAAAALSAYDPPTYAELEARTLPTASYATASALSTVDSNVDDIKAVTDNLPDSGALSSLATAAALAVVDGNVDSIKAKTDQLTFSVSGQVDANMQSINDGEIVGDGVGTPFDIASN